ncbi:hypothetical protein [Yoonia sp.]|uniref:hypothetical protein n=1 Tax=Yoonia sp. TaxID=2212373 RepID=UPI0023B39E7B
MKTLINKATTALSGVVLFAFGGLMVGLGLATMSLLALFAFAAVGIAILAAPLVAMAQVAPVETDDVTDVTETA